MNVCGLRKKLNYPEFLNFVCNYDILCFTETKTDNTDVIDIPGYIVLMKNRFDVAKVKSGGLILAVKENLIEYIDIITSDCKFVFWFKLSKKVVNLNSDILFGIVYIPPENTRYSSADCFTDIEQELMNFSKTSEHVCLLGDFNSRTGKLKDYVYLDNFLANHNKLDEETRLSLEDVNILLESNILHRENIDIHCNNYGYKFIEFCRNNNLFIVNGRIGENKLTCKDSSTVDYVVCNAFLFKLFKGYIIHDYSNLYSDVHCPITFEICKKNSRISTRKQFS